MIKIKFYTSHCARCIILKRMMDNNGIKYVEIDDENIYMPIAKENKILSMPFAEIDGVVYGSKELQQYIVEKGEMYARKL